MSSEGENRRATDEGKTLFKCLVNDHRHLSAWPERDWPFCCGKPMQSLDPEMEALYGPT